MQGLTKTCRVRRCFANTKHIKLQNEERQLFLAWVPYHHTTWEPPHNIDLQSKGAVISIPPENRGTQPIGWHLPNW